MIEIAHPNIMNDYKSFYQTKINEADWMKLKKLFSKTMIDSGGYNVPLFPNDTVVLKAPVYK